MARIVSASLVLMALGLLLGYFIFAKHPVTGDLLAPDVVISGGKGLKALLLGPSIEGIRQNIMISGAVGLVTGILTGAVLAKKFGR